ncbi:hypothetical protein MMC07_001210 [Pseudocyphellaria aurata]|nr:hypothetical protein [Pseudocyphellaria aurata]
MKPLSFLIGLLRGDGKIINTTQSKGRAEPIPRPSPSPRHSDSSPITVPRTKRVLTPPINVNGHSRSSVTSRSSRKFRQPHPPSPTSQSTRRRLRKESPAQCRRCRTPPPPQRQQRQQDEAHNSPCVPRGSRTPLSCPPPLSLRPAPVKIMPPTTGIKQPRGEYIETDTGNKVARRSQLHGTQHIILGGRAVIQPQVCIRGDLVRTLPPPSSCTIDLPESDDTARAQQQQQHNTVAVAIGRYSFISSGSLLRPPHKLHRGKMSYHPLKIGEHVFVGPNCVIEAASIGDRVHIGAGSVLGRFAILKEGCRVLEGTVVPGGMVVPSGCVIGGRPGRVLGEVGDGYGFGEMGGDLRELWRRTG